jgi:hypothetical protein
LDAWLNIRRSRLYDRRVFGVSGGFMDFSARRWLRALHDDVGAAGLAAAAALPGLSAMLDQHAAAVRDATTLGLESSAAVAGLVLLAGYGRGVLGYARDHGWQPLPSVPSAWRTADWTSLRLTAVCAIAQAWERAPRTYPPLNTI